MTTGDTTPTRYRFGPLQRRGLVAGWRGGQIGAVAGALVIGVGVVRASASLIGVVIAAVVLAIGVGVATWPIAGRTVEEWAPDALRHAANLGRGPRGGPGPFAGIRLIGVDPRASQSGASADARGIGVLHDRSRRTFTAVLTATDPGFVLLSDDDKARRVRAWSGVLASLARDGSAVHRVQWVERVVMARSGAGSSPSFTRGATPGIGHEAAAASYQALLEGECGTAFRHEVLLAVTVHAGRVSRAVKAAGGGDAGACAVLLHEVAALRRRLTDASIDLGAVLAPEALASVVCETYDPSAPVSVSTPPDPADTEKRRGARTKAMAFAGDDRRLRPMGIAAEWGRLRADGTWHATYWVAEWPRTDVGPDFLGPLLLSSEVCRTMSVVMAPLGPIEASRKVEQARTADIADAELRRRGGFLATARRRREEEILVRREVELADGHAQYRFSGYVTLSAPDPEALEVACGRVEQAAGQAGLELRRCYGDQANTFMCALPLGRGLS